MTISTVITAAIIGLLMSYYVKFNTKKRINLLTLSCAITLFYNIILSLITKKLSLTLANLNNIIMPMTISALIIIFIYKVKEYKQKADKKN